MIAFTIVAIIIAMCCIFGIVRTENILSLVIYAKVFLGGCFLILMGLTAKSSVLHQSQLMTIFPFMAFALFIAGIIVVRKMYEQYKNLECRQSETGEAK